MYGCQPILLSLDISIYGLYRSIYGRLPVLLSLAPSFYTCMHAYKGSRMKRYTDRRSVCLSLCLSVCLSVHHCRQIDRQTDTHTHTHTHTNNCAASDDARAVASCSARRLAFKSSCSRSIVLAMCRSRPPCPAACAASSVQGPRAPLTGPAAPSGAAGAEAG